jgi:mycoredoxin
MDNEIIIYGSSWCGYTQRALRQLDGLGVAYKYVDVDADAEAETLIASWNNGRSIRPTLDLGGDHFVNPSPSQLESELRQRGHIK